MPRPVVVSPCCVSFQKHRSTPKSIILKWNPILYLQIPKGIERDVFIQLFKINYVLLTLEQELACVPEIHRKG